MISLQPAYVLHARLYRETSLLLEVFSRDHGRLGMIARGVRGGKKSAQAMRASLQPVQPLLLSWRGKGELMQLTASEPAGPAPPLRGKALLSAFYINELILKLMSRGDANVGLFWRYAECLGQLGDDDAALGWELRRFERDLLIAAGYAMELDRDALTGESLEPSAYYAFDPESGPQRVAGHGEAAGRGSISGAALLGLANDVMPGPVERRELRRLMRGVLLHHLGGRELASWRVLADISTGERHARNQTPSNDDDTTPQV